MGMGPVPASKRALAKADWKPSDLDLMEINEALQRRPAPSTRKWAGITSKINVNAERSRSDTRSAPRVVASW